MKTKTYHLCLSQQTKGPIPITRNSFTIIGHTWADQVPEREFGKKDFMITYRKPPSLKDTLVRAKVANQETLLIRVVRDPIPANIGKEFLNKGK